MYTFFEGGTKFMETITISIPIHRKSYDELENFVKDFSQDSVFFMQVLNDRISFIPTIVGTTNAKPITMASEIFMSSKASQADFSALSSFAAKFNRLSFAAASKKNSKTPKLTVSIEDANPPKGNKKIFQVTLEHDDLDSSAQSLLIW